MALTCSFLRRSLAAQLAKQELNNSLLLVSQRRYLATGRGASKSKNRKPISRRRHEQEKLRKNKEILKAEKEVPTSNASASRNPEWWRRIVPMRYRSTGSQYTREHFIAMAQRLPFWVVLTVLFLWEETAPFTLLSLHGPSMLPTMAPDGSELWLRSTGKWRFWTSLESYYCVGDIVGFAHPDTPERVSCKRIVGVAGDRVKRYGQFVHLYVEQDPKGWGRIWPDETDPDYQWIDRTFQWDPLGQRRSAVREEAERVIEVPEGHVWLEADNPGLGIDSRQFGPVPLEWLRGKVVARVWPFWRKSKEQPFSHSKRPHPIPLDPETLRKHNVHIVSSGSGSGSNNNASSEA